MYKLFLVSFRIWILFTQIYEQFRKFEFKIHRKTGLYTVH